VITEFEAYLILILLFGVVVYVVFMVHIAGNRETQKREGPSESSGCSAKPETKENKLKPEDFEHV